MPHPPVQVPQWQLPAEPTCLSTLNQRDQTKFLESDIFSMSGDSWMKEPGAVEWSAGKGVFINNYSNFILWVGLDDQLRFVSLAKGTDLKYVLLRLQKAVSRIEEALKMVFFHQVLQREGVHQQQRIVRTLKEGRIWDRFRGDIHNRPARLWKGREIRVGEGGE